MAYLGEEIKKLGFGLMRLPKNGDVIDVEQVKVMVDKFLAAGFTYFDTAWAYAGSEEAIREALVERYPREAFQLATKNAAWINAKTREDAIAQFTTSLEKTGAGYFDYYLLHNLGNERTHVFDDFDLWNFVVEKKKEGLIKHVGFSFHSTPEELEEILKKHPEAEFVQLQINYADWEAPSIQSRGCYEVARKYGKSVIIMEPVKGGMLANPPAPVQEVFKAAEPDSSFASWAIRFCADLEGIVTVLSGMSSIEQMEDNLKTMKDFTGLSDREKKTLEDAREAFNKIPIIQCTACDYCAKVCPMEIGISATFAAMNTYTLYGNYEQAKGSMGFGIDRLGKKHSDACIRCSACEAVCPQHLPIPDLLEKATETFSK